MAPIDGHGHEIDPKEPNRFQMLSREGQKLISGVHFVNNPFVGVATGSVTRESSFAEQSGKRPYGQSQLASARALAAYFPRA